MATNQRPKIVFRTIAQAKAEAEAKKKLPVQPPKKMFDHIVPMEESGHDLKIFTPVSAKLALAASCRDYVKGSFSFIFEPAGNFKTWKLSDKTQQTSFVEGHPCSRMKVGQPYQYVSMTNGQKTGMFVLEDIDCSKGQLVFKDQVIESSIILNEYAGDLELSKKNWVLEKLVCKYAFKDPMVTGFFKQIQLEGGKPQYNSKFAFHQGVVGGGKTTMLITQLITRIRDEGLGNLNLFIVCSETNNSLVNVGVELTKKGINAIQITNEDTNFAWGKVLKDVPCYKEFLLLKNMRPTADTPPEFIAMQKQLVKQRLFKYLRQRVLLMTPSKMVDFYRMFKPEDPVHFFIDEAGLMKIKNFFPFLLFKISKLYLYGDHAQFDPHDEDDKIKNPFYFQPYKEIMNKMSTSVAVWFTAMKIPHKIYYVSHRLPKEHGVPIVDFFYREGKNPEKMAELEDKTTIDFNILTKRDDRAWMPTALSQFQFMHAAQKEKEASRMMKFFNRFVQLVADGYKNYKKLKEKEKHKMRLKEKGEARILKRKEKEEKQKEEKDEKVETEQQQNGLIGIIEKEKEEEEGKEKEEKKKEKKNEEELTVVPLNKKKQEEKPIETQLIGLFEGQDHDKYKIIRVMSPYTYAVGSLIELYDKFFKVRLNQLNVSLTFETVRKTQSEGYDYTVVYWPKVITTFIDDKMILVAYSRHKKSMIHTPIDAFTLMKGLVLNWMLSIKLIKLTRLRGYTKKLKDPEKQAKVRFDVLTGLWGEGDNDLKTKCMVDQELHGIQERLIFEINDDDLFKKFYYNGIYDRFLEYDRLMLSPIKRTQKVTFLNVEAKNDPNDLLIIEDALNEGKYPQLAPIEPKFRFLYYLFARKNKFVMKVRLKYHKNSTKLYLDEEGKFSYRRRKDGRQIEIELELLRQKENGAGKEEEKEKENERGSAEENKEADDNT